MTVRERIARAWHKGSDHAADGEPFGGPLCHCWRVADRMMPILAEVWANGYSGGYSDGYRVKLDGRLSPQFLNPYEEDQ